MYSRAIYSGDGSNRTFAVPFEYLSKDHVEVRIDGNLTGNYSWINSSTIQTADTPQAGTDNVDIRRNTPKDPAMVAYSDGSTLTEGDLNLETTQLLFMNQEATDTFNIAMQLAVGRVFDALGFRISNVGAPLLQQDAATVSWVQGQLANTVANGIGLPVLASVAAIRALDHTKVTNVFITGHTDASDGGGGAYRFDPTDSTSADNGGTVIVANDGARWKLAPDGAVTVKHFGAKGNGIADDTAAIRAARAYGYTYVPAGTYIITDQAIVADTASFSGPGRFLLNGWLFPAGEVNFFVNLPVPSVFPTIQAAATWVQNKVITEAGFCSIKIADGTYSISQVECHFPTGKDRVQIIGNQSDPSRVVINADMTNNQSAFLFQRGSGVFLIDGMTINGVGGWVSHGVWNSQCYGAGIMAAYGSYAIIGPHVRINKCYYGVSSRYSSTVFCQPGVQTTEAGDVGFHAFGSSSINCQGTQASYSGHTVEGLGAGYCAEGGSFIDASFSVAFNNNTIGFLSETGSGFWAHSCTAHNNGSHGFCAAEGGSMEANHAGSDPTSNSYQNSGWGYYAAVGGALNCNSCTANTNSGGGFGCVESSVMDVTVASSVNNTGDGFYCEGSSHMEGNPVNSFNNTGIGMHCVNGSSASFSGGTINQNAQGGLSAVQSSTIYAPNATIVSSGSHGVAATDCSSILCDNTHSNQSANGANGFYATACSTIRGSGLSANDNTGWGFWADSLSFITAPSAGGNANAAGFRSPTLNGTAGNNGAYIQM